MAALADANQTDRRTTQDRFDDLKGRFDALEGRFDALQMRFLQSQAQVHEARRRRFPRRR